MVRGLHRIASNQSRYFAQNLVPHRTLTISQYVSKRQSSRTTQHPGLSSPMLPVTINRKELRPGRVTMPFPSNLSWTFTQPAPSPSPPPSAGPSPPIDRCPPRALQADIPDSRPRSITRREMHVAQRRKKLKWHIEKSTKSLLLKCSCSSIIFFFFSSFHNLVGGLCTWTARPEPGTSLVM
ncbi:hypothetical protein BD289DRAFT_107415 [Coniella lustricola]|uniref:Uncharacterized protein n=1 Tax=Coniella lustricola TaxID=2025994 RepID=A0A2T3AGJ7_9PEZI|nr:hypothetical protein BD289DRAFT_107415 [Coniella lustricola]